MSVDSRTVNEIMTSERYVLGKKHEMYWEKTGNVTYVWCMGRWLMAYSSWRYNLGSIVPKWSNGDRFDEFYLNLLLSPVV